MKPSEHVAGCSWLRASWKTVGLATASSLMFVSMSSAEHFRSAQTVSIESDNANISKRANETSQVKGGLTAKGVGLFQSGSNQQEVVTVVMTTDFQGSPTKLTNHQVATLSFADGSTIRFESDGKADGKRGTYKIANTQGTGRFKKIKATGVIRGTSFDPSLSYVVMEGDYETP